MSDQTAEQTSRYTAVAIGLHWVIAIGIGGMIWLGWHMGDLPNDAPNKFALYQLHKSVGISILILTLARIAWRFLNPPPPLPIGLKPWEEKLSHFVHIAFYGLMILMPLTGWIWVSASPAGVPTKLFGIISWPHLPIIADMSLETKRASEEILHNAHGKLAWLAIALLGLHVGGALKHDFIDKEGAVLRRMLPGLFGKTAPPVTPATGVLPAFGGALAIFAVIALIPMIIPGKTAAVDNGSAVISEITPNWAVNYESSDIRVIGILSGYETPAMFPDWTADIYFDPESLSESAATVRLSTTTATANDAYLDGTLEQEDWLNSGAYPSIPVQVTDIRRNDGADAYVADIAFTLKGETYKDELPFTLTIDGKEATMSASLTVDRFALGIGAIADEDKDWIDTPLRVEINVEATRSE